MLCYVVLCCVVLCCVVLCCVVLCCVVLCYVMYVKKVLLCTYCSLFVHKTDGNSKKDKIK